ncbi:DoxX family protein [Autumnicola edwardsiae]|uniref:DoxX family protein n=1 Tax=Autumnicola edwardsiae TaxID=3075594 RepID=A0ABU3CVF0_9FLAO|nr:DoxX family protein [Zunongwangia sp. F297]MDT0650330.1 DoxX family protein [Zunongwangia sp. F297]
MNLSLKFERLHLKARQSLWLWYFAVFNRIVLALGFLPSGFVKVNGERFTALAVKHPMGSYLEAFYHTGYYYTFVGILQMTAAILLLIPRTATLGAVIYFPIILNICILSFAVRFDGSLLTAPLMVLANLYLLCWDYHKLKFILPFNPTGFKAAPQKKNLVKEFPLRFFLGVSALVLSVLLIIIGVNQFAFMPRNRISECQEQCAENEKSAACMQLCGCIHTDGRPLDECLEVYSNTPEKH